MKTILTIYCACMFAIATYAQEPDKALVKVQYSFIHIADTTQRDKPYTETMLLIAGKNASLYTSYDRIEQSVNIALQVAEMKKNGIHQAEMQGKKNLTTQYYFFAREHKFFSYEPMHFNYLVEDETEKPDWKIVKDTLSFSGIHCQKATARFKGRNWIAWFAAELPFESGPWKLNGLPGLIIEAYDDKKEVQFKFAGIQKIKEGDLAVEKAAGLSVYFLKGTVGLNVSEVKLPPEGELTNGGIGKITKKEYDKLKVAYDKDPAGFGNAQNAANGATPGGGNNNSGRNPSGRIVGGGSSGGGNGGSGGGSSGGYGVHMTFSPVTIVTNNPIELPEKK